MLPTRLLLEDARTAPTWNRGTIAQTGWIPPGYRFLQDSYEFKVIREDVASITEGKSGKSVPVLRVTGLFQEADKQNANGRVYPYPILSEAVKSIQEDVAARAVIGEYDHPLDAKIHLDRLSHVITKVWMDGKRCYGQAEVLSDQPHGAMLEGLFKKKIRVGISSRGVGDMDVREENGSEVSYVLPGYSIITWDVVADPSVAKCYLQPLHESTTKIRRAYRHGGLSKEAYESRLVDEIRRLFAV